MQKSFHINVPDERVQPEIITILQEIHDKLRLEIYVVVFLFMSVTVRDVGLTKAVLGHMDEIAVMPIMINKWPEHKPKFR